MKGLKVLFFSGTGKTLMARQIGKMLNTREPKIISGPGTDLSQNTENISLRIDGFHADVIRLQSQKSEVLRVLIYTRFKD